MSTDSNYIPFDDKHGVRLIRLPERLHQSKAEFDRLWQLHPKQFPSIFLHGRKVTLPRWQQAYGQDYFFSGQTNTAQSVPSILKDYLNWSKQVIDSRLNGMLLNWYDDKLKHYIGAHRDSTKGIIPDSVITMISLGASRVLRFRPHQKSGFLDVPVFNGDAIVMPLSTNQAYKHEVPYHKTYPGKRISITLRCFEAIDD